MFNKKEAKRIFPHSGFFPKNQRGQGMSTNTIILLILGIVVLVVLILGFTMGWNKIAPWLSGSNVDTIATSCSAACSTNSAYDFCLAKKDLKAESVKLKSVTCNYLSKNQTSYGISKCSAVPCDNVFIVSAASAEELQTKCTGLVGSEVVQALIENTLESFECVPLV